MFAMICPTGPATFWEGLLVAILVGLAPHWRLMTLVHTPQRLFVARKMRRQAGELYHLAAIGNGMPWRLDFQ
jgi:hypothetical protein